MSSSLKPTTTTATTAAATAELRQNLLTTLDKLSDKSTFSTAAAHLTTVAHHLSSDNLPTFISTLLTVDAAAPSAVKLHCLTLFSLLATHHNHHNHLSPHLNKLLPHLLHRLRDNSAAVRAAVSATAAALSVHHSAVVIPALLHALSSEQLPHARSAACVCLKESILAVDWSPNTNQINGGDDLLKKVLKKSLKLVTMEGFSKAKAGILGVVASAVAVDGGSAVVGGGAAAESVVRCGVEMLSCDDWCARKGGAEVLLAVAEVGHVGFVSKFKGFVVASLDSRRFDKVKVTRETMNRAWETWKEIPDDPNEPSPLPRSNSFVSKDSGGGSPPLPRRSSFGPSETYKTKKTMTKSRSSLSNNPTELNMPSIPPSRTRDTARRRQTLSKSRSSMSDDSTITDSSTISKSSYDFGFETPDSNKQKSNNSSKSKRNPSKHYDDKSRTSLDWKVDVAVPSASSSKFESEDEMESRDKTVEVTTTSCSGRSSSEEVILNAGFRHRSHGTRSNPIVKEDEVYRSNVGGIQYEEVGETTAESEELSLIRNQLHQIEKQQSDLLRLVQRFMGNSQNGIDLLETRVSGLERALDVISHDLAVQTGRIPNNGATGSTCCPSTEFLSPKFWRRMEGKSSNSKSSNSENSPNKDANSEALKSDGSCTDTWGRGEISTVKSVKGVNQNMSRGRTWSPKSFDTPTTALTTPVIRGA